jgi:ABC-type multidrug transport system fused ATPase/permease subunit
VGLVTQDVQLFRATLRDNLTLFDSQIPDERLGETLALLGLGDWYRALPRGLDTELGPGGVGVSAGQAQLLAFGRVFLKDPGLVILDEASSRLDPDTERLVEAAIDYLLRRRTAVIIAHRLSTIARVDRVVILEEGRIVEAGPRAALEADSGSHLAHLLRAARGEVPA